MKVIFCLRDFLPTHTGGTEVYVSALCTSLQALGVETIICKPGFGAGDRSEYFFDGIRILEYPESVHTDKALITGQVKPGGLKAFGELVLDEKPDIVHFHEISGANGITMAHMELVQQLGIPVFSTLHLPGYVCKTGHLKFKNKKPCDGIIDIYKCSVCVLHERRLPSILPEAFASIGMFTRNNQWLINWMPGRMSGVLSYPEYLTRHKAQLHDIFSISKKVFVLSKWFKKILVSNNLPENKMNLLEKAVPYQMADKFIKQRKIYKGDEVLRFVYIGRISKVKGLDIVLKAFSRLSNKNWELDIYGNVGDKDYGIACREASDGISGVIQWRGIINSKNVVSTLASYDALLFPTIIQEMVGLVVMEAFAAGIPVIGSTVNGISEQVINGENGMLFEPGNVRELSKILEDLLNDPSLLNSLKENIAMPGTFDKIGVETYQQYHKSVLEKQGSRL